MIPLYSETVSTHTRHPAMSLSTYERETFLKAAAIALNPRTYT